MTANITGLCVYEGLSTSLDTLTSQAFGNGKKHLVGLHVQRMSLLLCVVTIPIGAVWICSPWILSSIVPEKETGYLAGTFMQIYLIGGPGWAIFEAGKDSARLKAIYCFPGCGVGLRPPQYPSGTGFWSFISTWVLQVLLGRSSFRTIFNPLSWRCTLPSLLPRIYSVGLGWIYDGRVKTGDP